MSEAYEQVEVTSAAELRSWLKANHDKSPGIWLVSYKKAAGEKYAANGITLRRYSGVSMTSIRSSDGTVTRSCSMRCARARCIASR